VADYTDFLAGIPRLAALGPVFKSTAAVQLTEEETEYSILGIKHIFEEHILFQFNCTNTVPEQILENVSVLMDLAEAVSQLLLPPLLSFSSLFASPTESAQLLSLCGLSLPACAFLIPMTWGIPPDVLGGMLVVPPSQSCLYSRGLREGVTTCHRRASVHLHLDFFKRLIGLALPLSVLCRRLLGLAFPLSTLLVLCVDLRELCYGTAGGV
jgi:hypothetical protein